MAIVKLFPEGEGAVSQSAMLKQQVQQGWKARNKQPRCGGCLDLATASHQANTRTSSRKIKHVSENSNSDRKWSKIHRKPIAGTK